MFLDISPPQVFASCILHQLIVFILVSSVFSNILSPTNSPKSKSHGLLVTIAQQLTIWLIFVRIFTVAIQTFLVIKLRSAGKLDEDTEHA